MIATKNRSSKRQTEEHGFILPLVALLIFSALAVGGLVVEHSKESLALQNLQRAADSAALAGARQLDSSKTGWQDARRAAVAGIKANPIHGVSQAGLADLALSDPSYPDPWAPAGTVHTGISGSAAGLKVRIERGKVWYAHKNGKNKYEFESLETPETAPHGRWRNIVGTYMVANAVRVTLELDSLPTLFGQIAGIRQFSHLSRVSLAVSDPNMEIEVAPLAIPYCQLMLDTNVNVGGQGEEHLTDQYNAFQQQQRELVFTEADPKRNLRTWDGLADAIRQQTLKRREGLTRFESFIAQPYVTYSGAPTPCFTTPASGVMASCKHLPMYGTLGKPVPQEGQTTSPSELRKLFQDAGQGKLKAKLGEYFAPLEKVNENGVDIDSASNSVYQFIKKTNLTFEDVFLNTRNQTARSSFPRLRTIRPYYPSYYPCPNWPGYNCLANDHEHRPSMVDESGAEDTVFDLRMGWPTTSTGTGASQYTWLKEIMDHQEYPFVDPRNGIQQPKDTRPDGSWTNPLCHTRNIFGNDVDQPVRRTRAMVVAPSDNNYEYCDFESVFLGEQQSAVPPITRSKPVIVGTVEVYLFDFNFEDLDNDPTFLSEMNDAPPLLSPWYSGPLPRTVTPHYPGALGEIVDRHPGELDTKDNQLYDSAKDRVATYQQATLVCAPETDDEGNTTKKKPGEDADCDEMILRLQGLPDLSFFTPELFQCFNIWDLHAQLAALNADTFLCVFLGLGGNCGNMGIQSFEQLFNALDQMLQQNLKAAPFTHCLKQLRVGFFNPFNPDSYEDLHPLHANRGCGGIRGRVVHDETSSEVWPTGSSKLESSPAIINEDNIIDF